MSRLQRKTLHAPPSTEHMSDSTSAALFDRYGQLIYCYLRKYTKTNEDAEDLTVDVFSAALEKNDLAHLSQEEQLAWLKRVTHNKLIDTYRKTRYQTSTIDIFTDELYSNDDDPEQVTLRQEAYNQLHEYIRQLKPIQQKALYLRYAYNMSCSEIGVLLNKNEHAIRQLLLRTRALLRNAYHKQDQKGPSSC